MIRTTSLLFWFGLIIAASIALYRTSDRVQELNGKLHELNTSIETEQQSIHVLKAEWAYLANPARVELSAKKYLSLRPTATHQFASLGGLGDRLPMRGEHPKQTANATPVAMIKTSLAAPAPQPAVAVIKPKTNPAVVAAVYTGHLNDHMIMQRTASAQPVPDSIGRMISQLDQHP